jgi:hypothetical protein
MPFATHSDAMREYAFNAGRERSDSAWILDPRDVWMRNPFYAGPPQPHPEEAVFFTEEEEIAYLSQCLTEYLIAESLGRGETPPASPEPGSLSDLDDYEFF